MSTSRALTDEEGLTDEQAESTLETYRRDLASLEAEGDLLQASFCAGMAASLLHQRGRHEEALVALRTAIAHSTAVGEVEHVVLRSICAAEWLREQKDVTGAADTLRGAIQLASTHAGSTSLFTAVVSAHELLQQLHAASGDVEAALETIRGLTEGLEKMVLKSDVPIDLEQVFTALGHCVIACNKDDQSMYARAYFDGMLRIDRALRTVATREGTSEAAHETTVGVAQEYGCLLMRTCKDVRTVEAAFRQSAELAGLLKDVMVQGDFIMRLCVMHLDLSMEAYARDSGGTDGLDDHGLVCKGIASWKHGLDLYGVTAAKDRAAERSVRLRELAIMLHDRYKYTAAAEVALEASELAAAAGDGKEESLALTVRGEALIQAGQACDAVAVHQRALELAEAVNLQEKLSSIHCDIGYAWAMQGEHHLAVEQYNEALQLAGDDPAQLSKPLNNLGSAYLLMGEPSKAAAYHLRAMELGSHADRHGRGIYLSNMGRDLMQRLELEQAVECYEGAIDLAQRIGNTRQEGERTFSLGVVYTLIGERSHGVQEQEEAKQRAVKLFADAEALLLPVLPARAAECKKMLQQLTS